MLENRNPAWYENQQGHSWLSLWSEYVRCNCDAIARITELCPVCCKDPAAIEAQILEDEEGNEYFIEPVFAGAEGRYEDYVLIQIMQNEWFKPTDTDLYASIPKKHRPAKRTIIVLVFWTYFETRIERLFRETAVAVPAKILDELLRVHSSISRRLVDLYRIVFSTTYLGDLNEVGFGKSAELLRRVQKARNEFVHGKPESINDMLVEELVDGLKDEHDGWIAVFNKRLKENLATS